MATLRPGRRLACVMLPWMMVGCAGAPPQDLRPMPTTRMAHYRLPLGDVSSGGNPSRQPLPAYPPSVLAACPPPVEVRARLSVDRLGRVSDVRGMVIDDPAVTARWLRFLDAVRAAAMQWHFNPLQVDHWAADVDGNSHVVDSATEPFTRLYAFRFVCRAGKPVVGVDEVGSPQGLPSSRRGGSAPSP